MKHPTIKKTSHHQEKNITFKLWKIYFLSEKYGAQKVINLTNSQSVRLTLAALLVIIR